MEHGLNTDGGRGWRLEAGGWRLEAGGVGLIVLAVLGVYWPALGGQFLWDDFLVVHKNPLVTGELTLGTIWFRTDFPLSSVVFWLEWLAWGQNPLGYHVVNVLLHAASAVLLWRVLARLGVRASWLAGMLFAVHPVCVGSVAWIAELKNTLSLPFFLLSLLWYVRWDSAAWAARRAGDSAPYRSDEEDGRAGRASLPGGRRWYWLALGAFVLALLSKTSTVMLPVVLLLWAWWRRLGNPQTEIRDLELRNSGIPAFLSSEYRNPKSVWRDVLPASPFLVLALGFGLMTVWFQAHGAISGATVQTENFWGRLAGGGMALWFYLGKALVPLGLSMIYPRWTIDAASALSYLPLLLWCGLLAVCWVFRRTWGRHVLFGLGCFTALLFPVLGFFDMFFLALSRVSDHLVYLPLVALAGLGAAGAGGKSEIRNRKSETGRAVLVGVWIIGLAVLGMMRARVFVSEEALWRDTLARNPSAWCAHANLGWIVAEQKKHAEAEEHLTKALALKEDNGQAHSNLGRVLSLRGKFAEAEPHFQRALELKPRDFDIRRAYASALAEQGRRAEAVEQLREALRLWSNADARLQLATLLYQAGRSREAVAEYRAVVAAKPDQLEALSNLAWLLATSADESLRDGAEAVRLAEQACRVSGYKEARALGSLGAAYAEAGRFPEAVVATQQAISLARAGGDERLVAVGEQLLRLFGEGKAYHEAPAAPSGRGEQ